jgi:hypothetical protein
MHAHSERRKIHARSEIARWLRRLVLGPIAFLFILMALHTQPLGADDKYVGGHVGFGFPLIDKGGGNVSSLDGPATNPFTFNVVLGLSS